MSGFRFRAKTYADCPLRGQCPTSKRAGRTVGIRPDEAAYQALRIEQAGEEWKADYRVRPRVEHKMAELVHHGSPDGTALAVCAFQGNSDWGSS